MRMYKESPWKTTRIQVTPTDATIFQGTQGDTNGALNRTEWYANVERNGMRMSQEIPRNTAIFTRIRKNPMRFQGTQGNTKGTLSTT